MEGYLWDNIPRLKTRPLLVLFSKDNFESVLGESFIPIKLTKNARTSCSLDFLE